MNSSRPDILVTPGTILFVVSFTSEFSLFNFVNANVHTSFLAHHYILFLHDQICALGEEKMPQRKLMSTISTL